MTLKITKAQHIEQETEKENEHEGDSNREHE